MTDGVLQPLFAIAYLPLFCLSAFVQVQRAVAARQLALESELEQLHRANASALAKLETAQRAAAESMRSAGQALQAVITKGNDIEAFAAELDVGAQCNVSDMHGSEQARVAALESALPPLRVAAKRLRFTPSSNKKTRSGSAAGGSESQLMAYIELEGGVSCTKAANHDDAAAGNAVGVQVAQ